MKVWLYYIGKARDAASNAIAAEFVKRSSRYAACEMREIHPDRFDLWSQALRGEQGASGSCG